MPICTGIQRYSYLVRIIFVTLTGKRKGKALKATAVSAMLHRLKAKTGIAANSRFLRTVGPYSADSQEHSPDTNYYAAKGSLHE
mgnify:CR=1